MDRESTGLQFFQSIVSVIGKISKLLYNVSNTKLLEFSN